MKFLITLMEYDAPLSQIPDNTTSKSPPETPCNNGNKKSDDEKVNIDKITPYYFSIHHSTSLFQKQTDKVVESMAIIEDTVVSTI